MNHLLLTIASWFLPQGYRIAVPGAEILPPINDDHRRLVMEFEVNYIRTGNHWYCPVHDWTWASSEYELCGQCRGEGFKAAVKIRDEENPLKRAVPISQRMKASFIEGLFRERD
jgi:hypothetical protein